MNELYPACSPLSLRGGTAGCGSTWLQSPIICEADRCHNWHRMAPAFTGAGIRRLIGFRILSFVRVSETKTLRAAAAEKKGTEAGGGTWEELKGFLSAASFGGHQPQQFSLPHLRISWRGGHVTGTGSDFSKMVDSPVFQCHR